LLPHGRRHRVADNPWIWACCEQGSASGRSAGTCWNGTRRRAWRCRPAAVAAGSVQRPTDCQHPRDSEHSPGTCDHVTHGISLRCD
jgi:hypothetical protein